MRVYRKTYYRKTCIKVNSSFFLRRKIIGDTQATLSSELTYMSPPPESLLQPGLGPLLYALRAPNKSSYHTIPIVIASLPVSLTIFLLPTLYP